jgi:hypothetical protein
MTRFNFLLLSLLALEAYGQSACSICAYGDVYDEQIFRMTTEMTCADVEAQVTALATTTEDTECLDLQLTGYQIGCCEGPPRNHCTICPDGSDFDPNLRIPLGSGNDPTCAEAVFFRDNLYLAPFDIGTCDDTFLRRSAHYCGCQGVEQECFLCEGGAAPLKTDDEIVFAFNSACAGVEWLFSLFSEQQCVDVPLTYGFDAAAFCECPDYEFVSDYECSLCGEGMVLEDRSQEWTDASSDTFTCGAAEDFAPYFLRESTCTNVLNPAREQCTCVVDDGTFPPTAAPTSGPPTAAPTSGPPTAAPTSASSEGCRNYSTIWFYAGIILQGIAFVL